LKKRDPRGFIILVDVIDLTFRKGVPGGSQSFFFDEGIFKPFPESKSTPIIVLSFPYFLTYSQSLLARIKRILSTWCPWIISAG